MSPEAAATATTTTTTGHTITTPRLTIRTAAPSDGAALVAYFSNPANFPWPAEEGLTLDKMLPRIGRWADATAEGRSAFMVIALREEEEEEEEGGGAGHHRLIGFGGFNSLPRTEPPRGRPAWEVRKAGGGGAEEGSTVVAADVGVSIDHRYQRRGYAREAVCAVLEYGFEQLGCAYAHLDTQKSNGPMRALLDNLGMKGVEGDGSEAGEDAAFGFASKSVNYDVDKSTWGGRRDELKSKGAWPL